MSESSELPCAMQAAAINEAGTPAVTAKRDFAAESEAVVNARYDVTRQLGSGTYGVVCAAVDRRTGSQVAIKKLKNAIEDATDAKRLLRELKILRHFAGHDNVVCLSDLIVYPNTSTFNHLYIITEQVDTDLLEVIRSSQNLMDEHVRFFMYQLCRAIKYMHSAKVIHRDLKPNNLLVNINCDLKVCDFGLARVSERDKTHFMTRYVVTRWYRPPELLLGSKVYTDKVDLWSAGCILAEMLSRTPLFPGKNYIEMVHLIVRVLGNPTKEQMHFVSDKAREFLNSLPRQPGVGFDKLYPEANHKALDLLVKLLKFDPADRLSAAEALQHPYLEELHDPSDEPTADAIFDSSFENEQLDEMQYRELILKEVQEFQQAASAEVSMQDKSSASDHSSYDSAFGGASGPNSHEVSPQTDAFGNPKQ